MTIESDLKDFIFTYGWAVLSAVIVIGILAYFGVFSTQNLGFVKYECLAKNFCENLSLIYSSYQNDPTIWCKHEVMQNISMIMEFRFGNWETLKQMFPECEGK
jgi:hypothetical protein